MPTLEPHPEALASALWQRIELAPGQPGPWLDLAIHYCEQGQALAAERIFQRLLERHAPPPALRELIIQLRRSGCPPVRAATPARSAAHVQLRLSMGSDSNPNQGLSAERIGLLLGGQPVYLPLDPSSRPQADHFQGLDLTWLGPGGQGGADAASVWQPYALAALRRYHRLSALNSGYLAAGLHALGRTGSEQRVSLGLLLLDARPYHLQAAYSWQAAAQPLVWGLDARLQHYLQTSGQDSLQLEPRLTHRLQPHPRLQLQLGLALLLDQPLQSRPGGLRQGLEARLELRSQLTPDWFLEGQLSLQELRDARPYSPLFGTQRRAGQTRRLGLSLSRRLGPGRALLLSYQQQRAQDALPLFAFERRQLFLGLEQLFR